jgi:hypothetical protein
VFSRPFLSVPTVTTQFAASGATSQIVGTNLARVQLKLQGADNFWIGAASGVPSGAQGMPGLYIPSGAVSPDLTHSGPVFVFSGAANGATIAIRAWETNVTG